MTGKSGYPYRKSMQLCSNMSQQACILSSSCLLLILLTCLSWQCEVCATIYKALSGAQKVLCFPQASQDDSYIFAYIWILKLDKSFWCRCKSSRAAKPEVPEDLSTQFWRGQTTEWAERLRWVPACTLKFASLDELCTSDFWCLLESWSDKAWSSASGAPSRISAGKMIYCKYTRC